MGQYDYDGWPPYVPVAQRQRQAQQKMAALNKKGYNCQPIVIAGRAIAKSFWGKAWCDNLESYSDYENRLLRGRTYVRHGSVIDLRIEPGKVSALVVGSSLYQVDISVQPLAKAQWNAITRKCAGQIESLIELLQGRLSTAVMETVTRPGEGLFPLPRHISFNCSCPDGAHMCKHVAAALYGVGARLDNAPELLFKLRHVDPQDLSQQLASMPAITSEPTPSALDGSDLSALFGIDLDTDAPAAGLAAKNPKLQKPPKALKTPTPQKNVRATKPAASRPAARRKARSKTVSASDLIARGVARHMVQNWLATGVLLRTGQRGVYGVTAQTGPRIEAYLARAASVVG